MLISTFAAEALVPVALFYGIIWLFMRPASAHWGAHLLLVGGMCLAIAVLRYTSAFVLGGGFALNATLVWALIAPAGVAWAVAYWHARRLDGSTDARPAQEPAPLPSAQPESGSGAAAQREQGSVAERVASVEPTTAAPSAAPPAPAHTAASNPWSSEEVVGFGIAAAVCGLVVWGIVGLVVYWPFDGQETRERAAQSASQGHPSELFKQPMAEPGPARDADPAWQAARSHWERRNQEWLQTPGAREALEHAITVEDRFGNARSYQQLIEDAGGLAQRNIYTQRREEARSEPAATACPAGLIPDPSFNNQCNLPEAVEANKQAKGR